MAITDNLTRFKQLQGQLQRPTSTLLADADTTSSSIANLDAQRQQMMSAISRAYNAKVEEEQAAQSQKSESYDFTGKTIEQMYAETGHQSDLDGAKSSGFDFNQPMAQSAQLSKQGSILPGKVQITQAFGNYNPGLEPNKSGRNWGVDFGVKEGTPLALPPGEWEVVQAYNQAQGKGRIGNRENSGYGNSVLVRNSKTGETMRFSHLSGVNVQPGKVYTGGTVLGKSGATGNVTGPHLDLEYKNAQGNYQDILKSPYARNLFGAMGRA